MLPRPCQTSQTNGWQHLPLLSKTLFLQTLFLSEPLLPYSFIVLSSSLPPLPPPPSLPLITTQYTLQHGSIAAIVRPRCTRLHSLVSHSSSLSFSQKKPNHCLTLCFCPSPALSFNNSAPERPTPHGTQAARRWTSLLLDIILHPTRWHKLGLAVQWAKWVEWEGGLDLKGPMRTPGVLHLQNPLHPFALNQLLNLLDFSLLDIETLIGCADTGDWTCLFKEIDPSNAATDNAKIREQAAQSLQHLCLLAFYLRQGLCSLVGSSSMGADPREQAEDAQIQDLIARILRNVSVCLVSCFVC